MSQKLIVPLLALGAFLAPWVVLTPPHAVEKIPAQEQVAMALRADNAPQASASRVAAIPQTAAFGEAGSTLGQPGEQAVATTQSVSYSAPVLPQSYERAGHSYEAETYLAPTHTMPLPSPAALQPGIQDLIPTPVTGRLEGIAIGLPYSGIGLVQ